MEDELRFLYVGGDLPPADHRAFEVRYLRSLSDRTRLMFAKALAAIAADEPP